MRILAVLCIMLLIMPTVISLSGDEISDDLPSSFTWCDLDGVDYTPEMKNQAPAPTCEAYALCDAIETKIHYKLGENIACDLSEAHLFFYSGGTCSRGGVNLQDASNYLMEYGVPDEGCFPDPHRPMDTPFESLPGWENRTVKISGWDWVDLDEDSIKHALIDHGPLVICVLVRNDFNNYRGGIYSPGAGTVVGGHVITIVGYDDDQECWIIRNTWGTRWGEEGYVRVAYDAHTEQRPFFRGFYGGTGILYVEDVSGDFQPDVPKIQITTPQIYHTYLFGLDIVSLLRNFFLFQTGAPRILGPCTIDVDLENGDRVEFYLDGDYLGEDDTAPYDYAIPSEKGLHTIEVYGYNADSVSKDILDIEVI